MPAQRPLHSRSIGVAILIALGALGVGVCASLIRLEPAFHLRHPAVVTSAGISVAWLLLAWVAMLTGMWFARLAWTLGWLMLLVHLGVAFGVAHGWSHAAAVEHIREVGGFGAGIVVNYLFALLWGVDVLWWWVDPASRAKRPRWVAFAIHGFLLFVVVNATIVFGPPERRWLYAAALAGLVLVWWRRRSVTSSSSPPR